MSRIIDRRKILTKRVKHTPHNKLERIGMPTGILDCNGHEILTGEMYVIKNHRLNGIHLMDYTGIVLYHRKWGQYALLFGRWYGDNPYDADNYGKSIAIPKDNGMRMELCPSKKSPTEMF